MKINKKRRKILWILFALIISILIFTFFKLDILELTGDTTSIGEMKSVTKIIDGDTIIVSGGDTVRLLGIDADEKGYPCYYPAKERLEGFVLGKEVYLERGQENKDIYDRLLRYVLVNGENINLKLIQEGFVVARIEDDDQYKEEFVNAENLARENRVGCKWNSSNWAPGSNIQTIATWNRLVGEAISSCDAKNFIGQEKIVEGKVVDVHQTASKTVFMDFEKAYPNNCFTAVIFKSDLGKFNDFEQYANNLVRVKGKIKLYQGKPEIILENEDMIEIGK